ncbi:MAG: pilus assembly protein N-terminal domain-containing protein [Steroidobacteraceae bacterium]
MRLAITQYAALFGLLLAAWDASPAGSDLPARVDLFAGDSRILEAHATRIAVGNGKIVSAVTLERGQILLLAESPGNTTLRLWLRDGSQRQVSIVVTEANVDLVLENVKSLLHGTENVSARIAGGRIVLEGDMVSDAGQLRAGAVAALYPGLVLNFVGKVGWERMIHLDVTIVELRHNIVRDLGIRWRPVINGPNGALVADLAVNDTFSGRAQIPGDLLRAAPARVSPPKAFLGIATSIDSQIRLLEQRGDAVIVAEPRLSCRSGGTARFVAGGELPVPTTDGLGSPNVQFRDYGIILDVKPIADAAGVVYAKVETEISQIDPTVQVLGVPGLLKRESRAELNLRQGETLVLGGLVSRNERRTHDRLPGLGAMPGFGSVFGSRFKNTEDTDLVIFITPQIIQGAPAPGNASAVQPDPEAHSLEAARAEAARLRRPRTQAGH